MRYKVVPEWQSDPCSSAFVVVDMDRPVMIGDKHRVGRDGTPEYKFICECWEEADAQRIADALNRLDATTTVEAAEAGPTD